jgi:hypothetical protein
MVALVLGTLVIGWLLAPPDEQNCEVQYENRERRAFRPSTRCYVAVREYRLRGLLQSPRLLSPPLCPPIIIITMPIIRLVTTVRGLTKQENIMRRGGPP